MDVKDCLIKNVIESVILNLIRSPCFVIYICNANTKSLFKHVVHEKVVDGSSMVRFPLVIAASE